MAGGHAGGKGTKAPRNKLTSMHPIKPCKSCPFRRDVTRGALGGGNPLTFIGQAYAGMWLPCHSLYAPGVSAKDQSAATCGQCRGAAIFRANLGVSDAMPPGILRDKPDDRVFPTAAHFLAHHEPALTLKDAEKVLTPDRILSLVMKELQSAAVRVQAVRKPQPCWYCGREGCTDTPCPKRVADAAAYHAAGRRLYPKLHSVQNNAED